MVQVYSIHFYATYTMQYKFANKWYSVLVVPIIIGVLKKKNIWIGQFGRNKGLEHLVDVREQASSIVDSNILPDRVLVHH